MTMSISFAVQEITTKEAGAKAELTEQTATLQRSARIWKAV